MDGLMNRFLNAPPGFAPRGQPARWRVAVFVPEGRSIVAREFSPTRYALPASRYSPLT